MTDIHTPLTGGCLCGSIRYTINFPAGSVYPPNRMTCQCTQCRKNSGSLIASFITVTPAQIEWFPNTPSTYDSGSTTTTTFREFRSSPPCLRGFCSFCGSWLTWRNEGTPEEIDVLAGTLDEVWLRTEPQLAVPMNQYYCCNTIRGITDGIREGEKWVEIGTARWAAG